MSHIEEQVLIRKVLQGDQDAFERLYRAYLPATSAIVTSRVWNREDVEDLVQVTFMQAYMGLGRFRGEAAFSTWLTRIALNVCATHLRSRQAWSQTLRALTDPSSDLRKTWEPSRYPDPEEVLHQRERQKSVRKAVESLPASCREAVRMRYVKDRSYAEIARALRAPMGTVKTWLHRARRQLKEDLQQAEGGEM